MTTNTTVQQQVVQALQHARIRLETEDYKKHEPIAVVGMACRFPGGDNSLESFWQVLNTGLDTISEVPSDRWDPHLLYGQDPAEQGKMQLRYGGFLKDVDRFDCQLFSISPREAARMDPQQRLLLEVCWEAIERAGIAPDSLKGSKTGVFIGLGSDDSAQVGLFNRGLESIDTYSSLGRARSVASGRISYVLGLRGPALQLDTSCSSSLMSAHLACQSLRLGESDLALVGGVNLILSPIPSIGFSQLSALSQDGRCKTFDRDANGYVRGEGCGIVLLKRLSDAVTDRDHIFAVIRGSAANHDGRSNGLTAPNGMAQEEVVRQALANARVSPAEVQYVETHGTGTLLGDPIELLALGKVIGTHRSPDHPLRVGSVKTNIGHLEAAAGVASLIKVILALHHRYLPPSLHFQHPNPYIPWTDLPITVNTTLTPWETAGVPRIAGVSSFGMSGTNVHLVISDVGDVVSKQPETDAETPVERPLHLLTMSGKSPEALKALEQKCGQYFVNQPQIDLASVCFSANTGRSHFEHRLALITPSASDISQTLSAQNPSGTSTFLLRSETDPTPQKLAFLFTGQGSQYLGMGCSLYRSQPKFRQILDRCDGLLTPELGSSLLELMFSPDSPEKSLDQTLYTQTSLFVLEYALAQLWLSWGILPTAVMGHSLGEYVAACVAGVFDLTDGLKLVAARGRLMQQLPSGGGMLVVFAPEEIVQQAIALYGGVVGIAAINGPTNLTLSGDLETLELISKHLKTQGISYRWLPVSHAYHSPLMKPMLKGFEGIARQVTFSTPQIPLISNITGELISQEIATPEYWVKHICHPVQFQASLENLSQLGCQTFLEIGPKPVLITMGQKCLPDPLNRWLYSLRPGQEEWQILLQTLAQLYVWGHSINWREFDQPYLRQKVSWPTYPFQGQHFPREILDPRRSTSVQSSEPCRDAAPQGDVEDCCYTVKWQPLEASRQPVPVGRWLVVATQAELGQAFCQEWQERGHECSLAVLASTSNSVSSEELILNPTDPSVFTQHLREHLQHDRSLAGILFCCGPTTTLESISSRELAEELQSLGQPLLYLLHALAAEFTQTPLKLWVVVHNGMTLAGETPSLQATPLLGFCQSFGLECPTLWGGIIDLDAATPIAERAQQILISLALPPGEEQTAWRGGHLYVRRLVKQLPLPTSAPAPFIPDPPGPAVLPIRSDASYLVAGGLGHLGLITARWLARHGARHLILLSRHGVCNLETKAVIAQLEQQGIQVILPRLDLADETALKQLEQQVQEESLPPIRGIIQAAGTDGGLHSLSQLSWEQVTHTSQAKVQGTWHLHQLSRDWDLDFFVMYSSIASIWGSVRQGHYGVANAFLDAMVVYRRSLGLVGTTVNWSAVAGSPMVQQYQGESYLRTLGLRSLSEDQVVAALKALFRHDVAQMVVADMDWQSFHNVYTANRPRHLLNHLVTNSSAASPPPSPPPVLRQQLENTQVKHRVRLLRQALQREVAKLLEWSAAELPDPQTGFFDLGMDSLMAVELRHRLQTLLGIEIPSTLTFDFPSIDHLAQYLLEEALGLTSQETVSAGVPSSGTLIPARDQEAIAIIGMACRFPGANTPAEFWQLLRRGGNTCREIPADRWDVEAYYDPNPQALGKMSTRFGHFLDRVDGFDPEFFGISPREASTMDPQQRLLLEVSWEALEDAAEVIERLAQRPVGVFIGNDGRDYEYLLRQSMGSSLGALDLAQALTGNTGSALAGRLAYSFGLTGPCVTVDTACSSSLVAVHQACLSLRQGECEVAIAGGVKLHLTPHGFISTSKAQMLSTDGQCKTFDAAADGYARGEGCGVVILKPLAAAIADGNRILATIRGSGVNQDGPSSGLTVPNGQAQQRLIRQVLHQAQVTPADVSYLEAHGTGTALGDPIEVHAAAAVFGEGRSPETPLIMGSVKANIGHLEAAAGISGLMKVILSLQHRELPPQLHLKTPNPKIDWENCSVTIPTRLSPWPKRERPLAAVSSFGFTGTNAHVLVEAAPEPLYSPTSNTDLAPQLLLLSAKTPTALQQLADRYQQHLLQHPEADLRDLCFTAASRRLHHRYRLAAIGSSHQELLRHLRDLSLSPLTSSNASSHSSLAMLFTGQGSQYAGMGRELLQTQPVFRQAIEHCDMLLQPYLDRSLMEMLSSAEDQNELLQQTRYAQPALFALEYALYQLWQSWGITPDYVMGHSIGELVAACVAGVFSLEDGLKLAAHRGRLMQSLSPPGRMVSLSASPEQIAHVLQETMGTVSIAALNGPASTVLSGPISAIEAATVCLADAGIDVRPLPVFHAFHSPLMEPVISEFKAVAEQISYSSPQIPLISNMTAEVGGDDIATAAYWCHHILATVRFAESMGTLHRQGCQIFLEIGPKPVLLSLGQSCLASAEGNVWLPSLSRKQSPGHQLLQTLGTLYTLGRHIRWQEVFGDPPGKVVSLPTYPFQQQRYWAELPIHQGPSLPAAEKADHSVLGSQLLLPGSHEIRYQSTYRTHSPAYLDHHRLFDRVVVPAASHVSLLLLAIQHAFKSQPSCLQGLHFPEALVIGETQSHPVQLVLSPITENRYDLKLLSLKPDSAESGQSAWSCHATGHITLRETGHDEREVMDLKTIQARCPQVISGEDYRYRARSAGYTLGSAFFWMDHIWLGTREILSQMHMPELPDAVTDYLLYPGFIDSCFQLLGLALDDERQQQMINSDYIFIPYQIEQFQLLATPDHHQLWCHVTIEQVDERSVTGHLKVLNDAAEVIAIITGLQLRRAPREVLLKDVLPRKSHLHNSPLYTVEWRRSESTGSSPISMTPGKWLVLAPDPTWGEWLQQSLAPWQQDCLFIYPEDSGSNLSETLEQKLQDLLANTQALNGIVHLWSIGTSVNDENLAQERICRSTLTLLQTLTRLEEQSVPLWLVTQGGQAVTCPADHLQVQQATLWGLGRVMALEHPEFSCRCVDLDPGVTSETQISSLAQELLTLDDENQVAYRDQTRYVARLTSRNHPSLAGTRLSCKPQGSYVITGGLGALGLQVAETLAEGGAGQIVLLGRRSPSSETMARLQQIEAMGARVVVMQTDISRQEEVAETLSQIDSSPWPLAGIVHAAGVLKDGVLRGQHWQHFSEVFAAKVEGAWHLHQLTCDRQLDFFIVFSSIASVLGSPGQGNYAAANAFMDLLAYHRQAMGLPGLSINWGPWAEAGMAEDHSHQIRWLGRGLSTLDPAMGKDWFRQLAQQSDPQVVAMLVDWSKFIDRLPQSQPFSLLQEMQHPQSSEDQTGYFSQILRAVAPETRLDVMKRHIQEQMAAIFGSKATETIDLQQDLASLGMDSLMTLELRNHLEKSLGCSIPLTALLEYSTGEALARGLMHSVSALLEAQDPAIALPGDEETWTTLQREAELQLSSPSIIPTPAVTAFPSTLFMTGATGFLGSFLLKDCLTHTDATVYCLVRAHSQEEALARLQERLTFYGLWQAGMEQRLVGIPGDIGKPMFGWSEEQFTALAQQMDVVYHSAAWLNYITPYADLKPINVVGTQEAIRFASTGNVKPLHYVSTIAVFDSSTYSQAEVTESDTNLDTQGIYLGYSQSKWVAEQMVLSAQKHGFPVCIYRPPFISGHTESGVWNTSDIICRMIKGGIQLGFMPDLDIKVDLSPVDYVSQSIGFISRQPEAIGRVFHLNNPNPIHVRDLNQFINDYGYRVKQVAYGEWLDQLGATRQGNNSLKPLLPFFARRWGNDQLTIPELHQQSRSPHIHCDLTHQFLVPASLHCPPVSQNLLKTYFSYFTQSGFLPQPKRTP